MFSIFSPSLINVQFGPSVTGIGHIGPEVRGVSPDSIQKLVVPWHSPTENPSVFSLLNWHTRISEFAGREKEISELKRWAVSGPDVSVKFLTGAGGAGKSRLAAEFASGLQSKDWAAGFVNLRKPTSFPLMSEGTLLVIDYP